MIAKQVVLVNSLGLHARAAARFVGVASRFNSRICVEVGPRAMDGKSILGLLLLAAARGTQLTITAEGVDEAEAVESLTELTARGFEEP